MIRLRWSFRAVVLWHMDSYSRCYDMLLYQSYKLEIEQTLSTYKDTEQNVEICVRRTVKVMWCSAMESNKEREGTGS